MTQEIKQKRDPNVLPPLNCGCRLRTVGEVEERLFLEFCQLHESAPELLEACKEMLASQLLDMETRERVVKAIAKAEGRE